MPFFNFFTKVVPTVKAQEDDELVDPQETLKAECAPKCSSYKEKLDKCNARVNSRTQTTETCTEELFDFLHCVDNCVSKTLFSKLK